MHAGMAVFTQPAIVKWKKDGAKTYPASHKGGGGGGGIRSNPTGPK